MQAHLTHPRLLPAERVCGTKTTRPPWFPPRRPTVMPASELLSLTRQVGKPLVTPGPRLYVSQRSLRSHDIPEACSLITIGTMTPGISSRPPCIAFASPRFARSPFSFRALRSAGELGRASDCEAAATERHTLRGHLAEVCSLPVLEAGSLKSAPACSLKLSGKVPSFPRSWLPVVAGRPGPSLAGRFSLQLHVASSPVCVHTSLFLEGRGPP